VMLGASRKRFMGSICQIEKFSELVGATCTTTAFAVLAGVKIVRVHDIKENRQAIDVAYALKNSVK
jgi:dihydropteroate synthase